MPHVVIYNLSQEDFKTKGLLEEIEEALVKSMVNLSIGYPELELTKDDITFSFLQDPTVTSDEIPVVINVMLLFEGHKKTPSLKNHLARTIANSFLAVMAKQRKLAGVKVFTSPFDPKKEGFFSLK